MPATRVLYYISATGKNPVETFLDSLNERQQTKFANITTTIEKYGLLSILPHVRKLSGTPLWEIRVLGRDNMRIIYASMKNNSVLFLHGFVKKINKTPPKEISIALSRLNEWNRSP